MKKSNNNNIKIYKFSKDDYETLYEKSPDLHRTIDTNGIILNCNMTYAKALGYTKNELIGSSIFDHTPPEYMDKKRKMFKNWLKTEIVRNHNVLMIRKDGTTFPGLLSATTLYDKNGKIFGSNTVIRDISEIKKAREKIKKHQLVIENQLTTLQKLSKDKDEFMAMITHEIKTPLVPIKTYVDLMMDDKFGSLTEQQKQKLQIVKNSSDLMLCLVNDLLDAQKLEQGVLRLDKKLNSINKIVCDSIEKLRLVCVSRDITVVIDLQDAVSCVCDQRRIEQVLINILTNAIDFCPIKSGKIQIKLQCKNDVIEVSIRDNGIGIVKKSLEKVFQRFYQIDTTSTREHGGTGLGLSVCKGIIENHNGKIWAKSNGRDKGAEIIFQLPIN